MGVTYNDITALGYKIADSADATATVGAAIGNYTHERTQELIAQHPDDKNANLSAINNSYVEGVKATGVLVGLADQKRMHLPKKTKKRLP